MTGVRSELGGRQVDYVELYERHGEYAARRVDGSFEQALIELEATQYKIPNLVGLIPSEERIRTVLEIGCATGELIGNFPLTGDGARVGCDISPSNITAARERFPDVEFFSGDFSDLPARLFDFVILSDILEHVEDDSGFLRKASMLARFTLVNLPLEDNWLNRNRPYGPDDVSGHLRRYSLQQGLDLLRLGGLKVLDYRRVWLHETAAESRRRALRKRFKGYSFNGTFGIRVAKHLFFAAARAFPPFGRRMLSSNLFALAVPEND